MNSLRSAGYFETYLVELRAHTQGLPDAEQRLLHCMAGEWLPLSLAQLHYETCDRLSLSEATVLKLAQQGDGAEVRRTWLAQLIGNAKHASASPWTVLQLLQKLWERGSDGGAVAAYRVSPNEALVQYAGCNLFEIRYFRDVVRALLCLLCGHVCEDLVVVAPARMQQGSATYRLRWRA